MPEIRTYKSNPRLPGPVDGDRAGRIIGNAVQGLGQELEQFGGAIEQRKTQSDISKMNAAFALAQAEATNEWREKLRTADPNDPEFDNIAQDFLSTNIQTRLGDISELATTKEARQYYDRMSAGMQAHFMTSTAQGQADLAGVQAVENAQEMFNHMSSTVVASPESFEFTASMVDTALEGLIQSGGLSRQNAIKMTGKVKENLAVSAAQGMIDQDPFAAKAQIEAGRFNEFITGDRKAALVNHAESAIKAREVESRRALEDAAKNASNDVLESMIAPDGSIQAGSKQLKMLLNDPRFDTPQGSDQQRTMFNMVRVMIDSQSEGSKSGPPKTDPGVFNDLWSRAGLPAGDENRPSRTEIMNMVGKGLSVSDMQHILKRYDNMFSPDGESGERIKNTALQSAKNLLSEKDALGNPVASQEFSDFQAWALRESQKLLDTGTSPDEIWASDGPIMSRLHEFGRTKEEVREVRRNIRLGQPITPKAGRDQRTRPTEFRKNRAEGRTRSPEEWDKILKGEK